jgi:hypothetical protein
LTPVKTTRGSVRSSAMASQKTQVASDLLDVT